jgi:hypothetical protein
VGNAPQSRIETQVRSGLPATLQNSVALAPGRTAWTRPLHRIDIRLKQRSSRADSGIVDEHCDARVALFMLRDTTVRVLEIAPPWVRTELFAEKPSGAAH